MKTVTEKRQWDQRASRMFGELERPAKAMIRRAFRTAFCADELDDIYAAAWLGTLRALERKQAALDDDEIRRYLFTAVANQASKELRRRRRKPVAPLDLAGGVPDDSDSPEERLSGAERSRVARDVLGSLPPRRRAVIMMRYGWGLEPAQICGAVSGLSARAYRKEITRGVEQFSEGLQAIERGGWCADREPLLRALATGTADEDQARQARAHLAHCRRCHGYVRDLDGRVHSHGAAALAGAGLLAKLAWLGGGVAACACIAVGVGAIERHGERERPAPEPPQIEREERGVYPAVAPAAPNPPIQRSPAPPQRSAVAPTPDPAPRPAPAVTEPEPPPPPEFGIDPAPTAPPAVRPPSEWTPRAGASESAASSEFGP